MQTVIDQSKKKPNTKAVCIELEEKIEELLKGSKDLNKTDNEIMPPPRTSNSRKRSRRTKHNSSSEEEDDDDDSDLDIMSVTKGMFSIHVYYI